MATSDGDKIRMRTGKARVVDAALETAEAAFEKTGLYFETEK